MLDKLEAIGRTAGHAAALIFDRTAAVDPWLLALGTLLYLAAQTVRPRGWHTILRAAFPEATDLRPRDVIRAYLAGAGVNAIVPARGGDVVKLALRAPAHRGRALLDARGHLHPRDAVRDRLRRRARGVGARRGVHPGPHHQRRAARARRLARPRAIPIAAVVLVLVACSASSGRRLVRALRGALRQGTAILCSPRRFLLGVASWQALARLIRLGSFAAFMAAFGLPVTPATVVLVMAAQGGGRILPLAPASAGLRLAMLSYGFVEVTGHPVDIAAITAFTFGVGAVMAMSGLAVAAVILAQEFGTLSPRRALAAARAGAHRGRGRRRAGPRYWMSTGVPTGTRLNRSITSATCMRMQPCDARVPIE